VTLAEAMEINGLTGPAPSGVALRPAPPLLRAVWRSGVGAMATPRVLWVGPQTMAAIQSGRAERLLRHELTHVEQWRRHGRVGFLARYLTAYLLARAGGFSPDVAYRAIAFERAARAAEEQ
jgi:hypothetical protein